MFSIKTTFNVTMRQGECRAFFSKDDINPNTGKLGIRFYRTDTDCLQKIILIIQQLLGLTISLIDGSGRKFILSKNSLKNWSYLHSKKIPSNDEKLAAQIDRIFHKMTKNESRVIDVQAVKPHHQKVDLIQKRVSRDGPKNPESKKEDKDSRIENLINELRQNITMFNKHISSKKEELRKDIEKLKSMQLVTEESADFKLLDQYIPEIKPLKEAIEWATFKYSREILIKKLKQEKVKTNRELTVLVANNLCHIKHETAENYLRKDDPELFELAEEAKRLSTTLKG